jgi:hypothetical protein
MLLRELTGIAARTPRFPARPEKVVWMCDWKAAVVYAAFSCGNDELPTAPILDPKN